MIQWTEQEFFILAMRHIEEGGDVLDLVHKPYVPGGLCALCFTWAVFESPDDERDTALKMCAFIEECAWSWDEHSGVSHYPVPAPGDYLVDVPGWGLCSPGAASAYYNLAPFGDTEYGWARRRFAGHIADCLEALL